MIARPFLFIALILTLGACASQPMPQKISSVRFAPTPQPQGLSRSNRDIAVDFLDLTFELESGEKLDGLVRYEMPVRIYMRSPGLAAYRTDLEELLQRIRKEAGIDIAETADPERAQIFIEAVPSRQISRVFPNAACFIVPGVRDWNDFMRTRPERRLRWSQQDTLRGASIFLPLDTTPQDVRDCLHEEVTQALGPANDLYRLPDSIWNDDNFHGTATSFDMLILRTLYQPDLVSGMSRKDVKARLPGILNRINPQGKSVPQQQRYPESQAWADSIEGALTRSARRPQRVKSAESATEIASRMKPTDHRLGVSLLTYGRLSLRKDPFEAANRFSEAYRLFKTRYGVDDVRTAQAGVHVAAIALGTEQYELAARLADQHVPGAIKAQNAILVAGLLSIKAGALSEMGNAPLAEDARIDSLRWARYGFGDSDGALAREQAELTELVELRGS